MITIHKQVLKLTHEQELEVPEHSNFISCQVQKGELCVWYECNTKEKMTKRRIYINFTGHEIKPKDISIKYINTLLVNDQELVLHVYANMEFLT